MVRTVHHLQEPIQKLHQSQSPRGVVESETSTRTMINTHVVGRLVIEAEHHRTSMYHLSRRFSIIRPAKDDDAVTQLLTTVDGHNVLPDLRDDVASPVLILWGNEPYDSSTQCR
jgi:hypothetical protein